jgi:hypothetical protein
MCDAREIQNAVVQRRDEGGRGRANERIEGIHWREITGPFERKWIENRKLLLTVDT